MQRQCSGCSCLRLSEQAIYTRLGSMTYVIPDAFHANAIVMVGCGFVDGEGLRLPNAVAEDAELRRSFA